MNRTRRRERNHARRETQRIEARQWMIGRCAHCGHDMMSRSGRIIHDADKCDNCRCTDHDH